MSPTPSAAAVVVGGDRPVTVHVPAGYDPAKPAPLLVLLHGYGGSGQDIVSELRIGDAAAQRGYLYVAPEGTLDSTVSRFWNATDACCDFDGAGVDDATYLEGVIKEIETKLTVDPKRIDVVGHSNGAFMSYAMACTHADTIAAIVSLAGATFKDPAACAPKTPVAVLEIHGTTDDTIYFDGGVITLPGGHSMGAYPGARATVATWAKYDACKTSAVVGRACRRRCHAGYRRLTGRGDGDALGGLPTGRGGRALDRAGRQPHADGLGLVPRGRPRLPRRAPEAVG